MTIKQLRIGNDNFCYILYDTSKQAAVIDPGYTENNATSFLSKHTLNLRFIIASHHHGDHITSIPNLKKYNPKAQIIASFDERKNLPFNVDILVSDHTKLKLGQITLHFIHTPGHTPGSICIKVNNSAIITGDTLFIDDCGRTDLPGGSLIEMYNTLQKKILPLSDELIVYPGHDYGPKPFDTLGNQKNTNKTLTVKSFDDFSKIE